VKNQLLLSSLLLIALLPGGRDSHSLAQSATTLKGRTLKPNVIYIYADDMGYGELGCYGQQKIRTPNLDGLARDGMRFTQHYASSAVCSPSRCMLMTGKNAGHAYIRGNYEDAPDSAFDYYKGRDYSTTKLAEKALAFIRNNKDHPFFLYLPFTVPHVSLQAPDEAVREYIGQFDEQPYYGDNGYAPCLHPLSTYAAMITYMDKQIGRIIDELRELGLTGNTIVMFTSDNGPTFDVGGENSEFFNSAGGLRGRKEDLYEGGIREPFMVKWPGKVKPGTTSGLISVQYDLMATLSELTGIPAWPTDGLSFLPTLLGHPEKQKLHSFLYWEFSGKGGQIAIRIGDWKGVKSNMEKDINSSWEVYNLKTDEDETMDVAGQHPDLVRRFEAIVKKEHQQAHIREWEFVDPKY
jgi:arylsulfatase A